MVWTEQAVADWRNGGVRPVVAVWTVEQTRQFLDFVSDHRLYPLFHLVVMTGLRRGEAVGLRWEDVDLDCGTVRVCASSRPTGGMGWWRWRPRARRVGAR